MFLVCSESCVLPQSILEHFPTSLPTFVITCLFNYRHLTVVVTDISVMAKYVKHLFMRLLDICTFFGKQSPLPTFNWVIFYC